MVQTGEENDRTSNLSKKVSKLLETRIDSDKETLLALKELSTFFPENTPQARRNLHTKIEKRSLEINEEFVASFRKVKESLDSIYFDVNEMNASIQNISSQLNSSLAQTHALIDQTSKLKQERQKLTMEEDVVNTFIARFQLSPTELSALRESAVTGDFFNSLDKVQRIHSECRALVQAGHQTAALDIMDQMTMYQETGMERLYRWAQVHCKNIESEATGKLLSCAMAKLQVRPVLFKYVVNEYCTQRRSAVVKLFIDALTKGSPTGDPPPIEMYSYDPHRYVGDMLCYLKEMIPVERNLVQLFLSECDQSEFGDLIEESLSDITEGICTPLRVRVEHVIASNIPIKSLYTVNNLIASYQRIFSMELSSKSGLVACLISLAEVGGETLLTILGGTVRRELADRAITAPSTHLTPSLDSIIALLQEILSAPSDAVNEQQLNKIVGCVVDPVLQAINISASRLSTTDMAVYLLNCLHQLQTVLSLYQFLDTRLERLQAQIDAQLDTLTSEQASSLVANLNLGPIYTILQEKGKGPLSEIPGLSPTSISNFASKLDSFVNMPDMLTLPQVNCLLSSAHREAILHRSSELILAIYKELYACIHDNTNNYTDPKELLPLSPQELADLIIAPKSQPEVKSDLV